MQACCHACLFRLNCSGAWLLGSLVPVPVLFGEVSAAGDLVFGDRQRGRADAHVKSCWLACFSRKQVVHDRCMLFTGYVVKSTRFRLRRVPACAGRRGGGRNLIVAVFTFDARAFKCRRFRLQRVSACAGGRAGGGRERCNAHRVPDADPAPVAAGDRAPRADGGAQGDSHESPFGL